MPLEKKSIHQLRAIAQGHGIPDVFSKDAKALIQAIQLRQKEEFTPVQQLPPRPEYDARLLTKPPSKSATEEDVLHILDRHIKMGLKVMFPAPHRWHMIYGQKEDTGTTQMPLRVILNCAENVMKR